jgi:hypothetical protein
MVLVVEIVMRVLHLVLVPLAVLALMNPPMIFLVLLVLMLLALLLAMVLVMLSVSAVLALALVLVPVPSQHKTQLQQMHQRHFYHQNICSNKTNAPSIH